MVHVPPFPSPRLPGESQVVLRALALVPGPHTLAIHGTTQAAASLAHDLEAHGVTPVTPGDAEPTVHVLVAGADTAGTAGALAALMPWVVAAEECRSATRRVWPVWDTQIVAGGYEPCLHTGPWQLYVRSDQATALGPLLSFPLQDDERRRADLPTIDSLTADVVRWRTAALSRWAERATDPGQVPVGTAADSSDEVARLRAVIEEIHRTVSWRVTAPLRIVQGWRLRAARR